MYREGVTCSDCHDPHSLKLRRYGNKFVFSAIPQNTILRSIISINCVPPVHSASIAICRAVPTWSLIGGVITVSVSHGPIFLLNSVCQMRVANAIVTNQHNGPLTQYTNGMDECHPAFSNSLKLFTTVLRAHRVPGRRWSCWLPMVRNRR
jgi:hypothetical protein